jgi:hypothetical protein
MKQHWQQIWETVWAGTASWFGLGSELFLKS